jgi:hypothetical protein
MCIHSGQEIQESEMLIIVTEMVLWIDCLFLRVYRAIHECMTRTNNKIIISYMIVRYRESFMLPKKKEEEKMRL